jgi:hypothetical protein
MKTRAKRLPRLWCALQGLLPFEACLAAQRGELAWPPEDASELASRVAPFPVKTAKAASDSRSRPQPSAS